MRQADQGSPPWSARLIAELDAADNRARAIAAQLSVEQLNWKPSPGQWSVGQCLDHLCVANDVYLAAMCTALPGRPRAVVAEITPGWFGRWFIRNYIEPSPVTKRGRAPRKIVPGVAVDTSILERFLSGNRKVREFVIQAAQYAVNRIRFKNPFIPIIFFTVGTGLEILVRHQRRHLLQAERIKKASATERPASSGQ